MNGLIFFRYCFFLIVLIPTYIYAVLPLWDSLRFRKLKGILIPAAGLAAIIIVFALLGTAADIAPKFLYAVCLVPLFALFHATILEQIGKKLFVFLNSVMIMMNCLVVGILLSAPMELHNPDGILYTPSSLVCLCIAFALGVLYQKTLRIKVPYLLVSETLDPNWGLFALIPAAVSALFFYVTPNSAEVVMTGRVRSTSLIFLILCPIVFLLVYHVFWKMGVNLSETSKLREENELLEMESKRYEELRSYMNETRALRHDFRQHLLAIDQYAKDGEMKKLTEYIGQFTASLAEHKGSFASNPAIDAVASHYDRVSEEQQTRIKWMIELPEKLPLAESDFIAIFGNLVENAIHATAQLPAEKRNILVHARMLSDAMLGLTVRNPYEGTIHLGKNGLPRSERSGHGVGLSSVSAAVRRYSGTLEINTDGGVFTAGVLLCLNET